MHKYQESIYPYWFRQWSQIFFVLQLFLAT